MSLGLKRGTVQLEPHDKQWDEAAIQTIKILNSILGDAAIDIQHIGSTAIPAIKAKPIIDIVVGVTDFEKIMSYNEQLQKDGIFYRGSDVEDQILYVMGDMKKDIRTYWQIVKDRAQAPALIANCMRNIIEYFFNFVEKLDFPQVFQKPELQDIRFLAFNRYMNRESHSKGQNIFDIKEFDYDSFRDAFKLVFEIEGYPEHYQKMMK